MPCSTRYSVFFLCILSLILAQVKPAAAQQKSFLDKKVTFTFTSITLENALRTIGTKNDIKFSYNPELIKPGRRITMKFSNMPLRDVLKQLLNDPSLSFHEIGNQIVIYRGDPTLLPLEPDQELIVGKPQIVPSKKTPDTVYYYRLDTLIINRIDTVFRSISITRFDTIRITDTVFVEKNKPAQKAGKDVKPNFEKNSVKHKKFLENNGFYTAMYFEMLAGSASFKSTTADAENYPELMKKANSGNLAKFSAGLIAGYDYNRLGIRTGVGFTRLGEKFEYAYNIETGGFFKNDTVETYYTITGTDTSFFYITKPVWIPKDSKSYKYQNPNTYKYIDIPLLLKFRFWQNESAEIYALGGMNTSILVAVDALRVDVENDENVLWSSKTDLNPVMFSWQAGIGSAIKFTERSGLIAEAVYRKQVNSQYKDLPVDKRYSLIGLKVAAYLKF